MTRVVIVSGGYLGDVAVYIPIGRRLVEAGHAVTFVAPAGYASVLRSEPFEHRHLGLDFSAAAMHADPIHARLMRHPLANTPRLAKYWLSRTYLDDCDAVESSIADALSGADVLLTHPVGAMFSLPLASAAGVPGVVGHMFPMLLPTEQWTPSMPYSFAAPRSVNRLAWKAYDVVGKLAFPEAEINDLRRRSGMATRDGAAVSAYLDAAETVVLASPHYAPPADDWPPVTMAGFSVWDGPADAEVPAELDAYVDAGDPPVLVTLGTSAATDAAERFARIRADLAARGLRSIVLAGNEANAAALAGEAGVAAFAPLTALLPRCCAVVVSGAYGSVAAAVTAGIPTVVHPQLWDQFWHGRQVRTLGVGALARAVGQVADRVESILSDDVRAKARDLAASMAGEDGVGVAVDAIERAIATAD
jgi:UDP:flavonoid glycosyltransferase YjiC (YdhE family)